jgi:tetratricopeptide (TPR) repeat protein
MWDDTRGAISRNPNLRVLGRETMIAFAGKHLDPAAYRRKAGADYLLDGSVQHVGNQVQMKVSLIRTTDGAEVWNDRIGGKLDDVFAFQTRIANEVEGRIRGRVAPGGGTVARNIATSADVYSLFAEARAKIRQRGRNVSDAIPFLKKALAIDPNYAPAWAELGKATKISGDGETGEDVKRKAAAYARHALALAPNLANAHAALGFVEGAEPQAEIELRRAIALDPSDVEAWMWLGNYFLIDNRVAKALEAHSRAVELDPLWFNSMFNKMDDYARLRDMKGLAAELRRAQGTGDEHLILLAREHAAILTGHYGTAGRILAEFRRKFPDEPHKGDVAKLLLLLGYIDETAKVAEWPAFLTASIKGTPESPQLLRTEFKDPVEFWEADDGIDAPAMRYARLLPKHGRLAEYVGYYKSAFRNVDDFYRSVDWPGNGTRFLRIASNAAVNLRAAGQPREADAIIEKAESIIEPQFRNGPVENENLILLAQVRAAQGRDGEVLPLLNQAVARGWLPNRVYYAADIADEPCFARLVKRSDFQSLRRRIFARYDEERRALGPMERIAS